ncbi:MAG: hypothetical protein P0119_09985 [Nitrospira sp.]|nr:hypothetical protein [Nitrospira sp.]
MKTLSRTVLCTVLLVGCGQATTPPPPATARSALGAKPQEYVTIPSGKIEGLVLPLLIGTYFQIDQTDDSTHVGLIDDDKQQPQPLVTRVPDCATTAEKAACRAGCLDDDDPNVLKQCWQRCAKLPDCNGEVNVLPFGGWHEVPGNGTTAVADTAVSFGNKLYLFGIGIGDHHHYMNVLTGNAWSGWTAVPGGGTTLLPDAAVAFGNKLYLFGIGINDHRHYVNTFDGAAWSGWTAVPGGGTTLLPDAAVAFGNKLYLFGIGINDHRHYVNTFDGAAWSGWNVVPGGGTTVLPDTATVYKNILYLFGIGINDYAHYMNRFDGATWSGWHAVPGGGTTGTSDSVVVYNGQLYLFATGLGDHGHYVNAFDGTSWSGWTAVPGGGTVATADAAVVHNNGLYLFAVGGDQRHYVNVTGGPPRYNQVFRKATHNSYWVNASTAKADAFAAGPQQRILDQALFEHTRGFEIDIHYKIGHPGEFDVYHTDNQDNSTCYSLEDCLELMRRIDYVLPNHDPINFIVEFKEVALPLFGNLGGQDHHAEDLDRVLWERLGSKIYTPREFLERCPPGYSLRDCAHDYGWPTTDELRGRYIVNVIGNYYRNDESYRSYTDEGGGILNRAAFPLRSILDHNDDTTDNCTGTCATRRANEVFWQVEDGSKPGLADFLAHGGVARSGAAHMIGAVPAGNSDDIGKISQQSVLQLGYQMVMTDYPWNFIEDEALRNPSYVPSAVDRPSFQAHDAIFSMPQQWDPSLLREQGGRIFFDTAIRYTQPDRLTDVGITEVAPDKTGYAEAFQDVTSSSSMAWEVFPSTTSITHGAGPRNNGAPGTGCFFARSLDNQNEVRVCRIALMNRGRDVDVRVTVKDQGAIVYDNTSNVHKNVVSNGLGDAFRVVLTQGDGRTQVSVMTGNVVAPDGTMWWVQHPVNAARGTAAAFYVTGRLARQGLSADHEVVFTGTTLDGQPVTLSQLTISGGRIRDLSFCLDGSCRQSAGTSHAMTRRSGGNVWIGVHETEGRVFGQWRTLYTTDRFEVSTSGLGQYPRYEKFELSLYPSDGYVPLYRCVDWRRNYHQHWLSTNGGCPNPSTKEPFALGAGIIGYISTTQQPNMQPLWHLRKGTHNAGSADTHDHYFAVGNAERDIKRNQERYSLVGFAPIGYVYTPATLP